MILFVDHNSIFSIKEIKRMMGALDQRSRGPSISTKWRVYQHWGKLMIQPAGPHPKWFWHAGISWLPSHRACT